MPDGFKRSAATALLALVQKLSLAEEVDEDAVTRLVVEVIRDPMQRTTLIEAFRKANDPDLRSILIDRLRVHAITRNASAERFAARDAALGQIALGVGLSLIGVGVGATFTGALTGFASVAAIGAPLLLLLGAGMGKLWLSDKRVAAKHDADLASDLAKSLSEVRSEPADPVKPARK